MQFSKDVNSRMDGREITFDDKAEIREGAKEILQDVGLVEEMMVDGFPYDVPEEYANLPQLKGRALVEVDVLLDTKGRVIAGMVGRKARIAKQMLTLVIVALVNCWDAGWKHVDQLLLALPGGTWCNCRDE